MRHIARLFEADEVVILDLAPLSCRNKDSFVARNRISGENNNCVWLTVPVVRKLGIITRDALIDPTNQTWRLKHIGRIAQCYPDHKRLSPLFLDSLVAILRCHDGTLLNLNLMTVELLATSLLGKKVSKNIRLQSSLVTSHTPMHRLEIASKLKVSTYIAGHVEWEIMKSGGQIEMFRERGIEVLLTPQLIFSPEDHEITTSRSGIHAICRDGIEAARNSFTNLLGALGVYAP